MSAHTVMLLQFTKDETTSRTYLDFEGTSDAMDTLVQIYEQRIEAEVGNETVDYTMRDVVMFVDNLADISVMIYDNASKVYIPHGKDWIKSRLYSYLKTYSEKPGTSPKTTNSE
jgi:hypothetical protein